MAEIYGTGTRGTTTQRSSWGWLALAVVIVVALLIALAIWWS